MNKRERTPVRAMRHCGEAAASPLPRLPRQLCCLAVALAIAGCAGPRKGTYEADPQKLPSVRRMGGSGQFIRQPATDGGEFVRIAETQPEDLFIPEAETSAQKFAEADTVKAFSEAAEDDYRLGPGDRFSFLVRGREDISLIDVVVAPDGLVSLPRVGVFRIAGMTLPEATAYVRDKLVSFYEDPDVTLQMTRINNNKVYVLGRVATPGAVHFSGQGTLLEALSLAGGLPADTRLSFLSRCMIVRGNEMLIWIDLRDLLENGNLAMNARLQNGDFIFIPQSEDQVAYVMGQVPRPGLLVLRSQMTLLDAVMQAGGLSANAAEDKVFLVRTVNGKGHVDRIDFRQMVNQGDLRKNYVLKDGDIVYVGQSGMGKLNTFIMQLIPGMRAVDFTLNTAEAFGAMAELRKEIWGQEGFINRTSGE